MKSAVGQKDVEYEPNLSKEDYIHRDFEELEIGIERERTQYIPNNIQANKKNIAQDIM